MFPNIDSQLFLLVIFGLLGFLFWIYFNRKQNNKLALQICSFSMFLAVILILWRVFQLNLDFGLVLTISTLFAGLAWILGVTNKQNANTIEYLVMFFKFFISILSSKN